MSRKHDIINTAEREYGVEIHDNDIPDILCDDTGCRHSECECWDNFRKAVEGIAEKQMRQIKLRGSMTVFELREALSNAPDPDAPVFVNNQPIHEAYWDSTDGYQITSGEAR